MEFYKIPVGFGMALAMNPKALNAWSAMTDAQQALLARAYSVRSKDEMYQIVHSLAAQ